MKLSKMEVLHEDEHTVVKLMKLGGSEVLPRVQFHFLPQFLNKHVVGSINSISFAGVLIDAKFFQMIEATEPERLKASTLTLCGVDARGLSVDKFKQLLGG